ncbi:MAG TPA: WD40 repeat domain-containing protein [Gelria sp.]|jgi:WD40 repeat protein|nr:WD40 repeat domain-containing protein [Gelria sp.]
MNQFASRFAEPSICGLCQDSYLPAAAEDVICTECENKIKNSNEWIAAVFYEYKDNDFEFLMALIPRVRQQMKMRATQLCQQAVIAYKANNFDYAATLWKEARRYDSKNIRAAFNLSYLQWKTGEISYEDFIFSLRSFEYSRADYSIYHDYLAKIEQSLISDKEIEEVLILVDEDIWPDKRKLSRSPVLKLMRSFIAHQGKITSACFSSSGNQVLTAGLDGRISLWDVNNGMEVQRFNFEYAQVTAACMSPDDNYVLATTDDYSLHLLDLDSGKEIRQFRGHTALPVWVGIAPYGRLALSGGLDGTIGFWDLQRIKPMNLFRANTGPINRMWMSSDGMSLMLTGLKKEFRLLDLSGEMKHLWLGLPDRWPYSICSTDEQRYALSGNTDGSLVLWDLDSGKNLLILEGHRGTVNSLVLTKDSNFAISAGIDRSIRIWDINAGTQIHLLPEHTWQVNCLEIASYHHSVLTAGENGQLKLWEFSQPC